MVCSQCLSSTLCPEPLKIESLSEEWRSLPQLHINASTWTPRWQQNPKLKTKLTGMGDFCGKTCVFASLFQGSYLLTLALLFSGGACCCMDNPSGWQERMFHQHWPLIGPEPAPTFCFSWCCFPMESCMLLFAVFYQWIHIVQGEIYQIKSFRKLKSREKFR